MLKNVNFKLDSEKVEQMKAVCGKAGISQADFLTGAIDLMMDQIIAQKCGGALIELPPLALYNFSEIQKGEIIAFLDKVDHDFISLIGGNASAFGLTQVKIHAMQNFDPLNEAHAKEHREDWTEYMILSGKAIKDGE